MSEKRWSGSRILVETLLEQGVTQVFGYPGGQVLDIYDELFRVSDRLRHVLCAHEQGAAHAADGYARATGKVGVVIATSGPGATNLVTGIATAMLDSVPMVAITGNVPTTMIGKDGFQEINITGVTMPITKHNYFVSDVRELADTVREAFRIARSGRPGPVLIDVPQDVQKALWDFTPAEEVTPFPSPSVSKEEIDQAVRLIRSAHRPYLYVGGGAASAQLTEEILALAERCDAAIGCSLMGLSVVPHSCPRFLGMQGMHGRPASSMAQKEADLIVGIGVRFSDRATGDVEKYARDAKILQLDIDSSEVNKNVSVDLALVGDLKETLSGILAACKSKKHPRWQARLKALKAEEERMMAEAEAASSHKITPRRIFEIVNALKGEDTVVVTDVGQHQMWTAQQIDLEKPRRWATSGGLGTMGYGMGAAVGAHVGSGDRVLLVTGDGSFGMNLNELATAVTYEIPLAIVLMNNGALGMVRQWQHLFFEKRYAHTVLDRKTDFVKLAQAFGAEAQRVCTPEEFEAAFTQAIGRPGPTLIEVVMEMDEFVLPMLPPGGSVEDIITEEDVSCVP